jgi:hypothetical protein
MRTDSRGVQYTMREVYRKGVKGGTIPAAPPFLMAVLAGMTWSPTDSRDWDVFVRAMFDHDPDAWETAALHIEREEQGKDGEEG